MKAGASKLLVVDASVAIAWCLQDEATADTDEILDALVQGMEAYVPALWPFEVANALLVAERRRRITVAQVTSMLQRIALLPINIENAQLPQAFSSVLAAARQEGLSEYDAAYFELALRRGLPLATLDDALRRAARKAGIRLVLA